MTTENKKGYFLGANSVNGFFSVYSDLADAKRGDFLYIIKSGPGSGKSSFMRKTAEKMTEKGHSVEYIYCSGDPDSLDAVYFPQLKTAIVDGTSPHVIEPAYPGIGDTYIDFSPFYDIDGVKAAANDVIHLYGEYKGHYAKAYKFLAMYGKAYDGFVEKTEGIDAAVYKKASSLLKKHLSSGSCQVHPYHKRRFIAAVTHKGRIFLPGELQGYEKAVVISGLPYLTAMFCRAVKDIAESSGISTVSYLDPLFPDRTEHIALPEHSLVFVSKWAADALSSSAHKVNLDLLLEKNAAKEASKLKKAADKSCAVLLDMAADELKLAKLRHDELEKVYNPYIDFDKVYALSDTLVQKLS